VLKCKLQGNLPELKMLERLLFKLFFCFLTPEFWILMK